MIKNLSSNSGFANIRTAVAVSLCLLATSLGWFSFASTPSSGTLSPATPVLTYDAGPFDVPNQSPLGLGQLDVGPRCDSTTFPCDNYLLTANLPSGYVAAHPNAAIKVTMSWTDTGSGQADYDLYIYKGDVATLDGSQPADHQSATGADPEVAVINPLVDGASKYSLKIVPVQPTQETLHVRIELLPGSGGVNAKFGGPDPTTPGVPRYQVFEAPSGSTAEASQGEFNIGFNPQTGRIMVMNIGPIWRLTPPELLNPAKPACCEALWEDRSANTTNVGLDPILWTDELTGRTFASNSTAGANVVYAYSDSDGEPSVTQPTGWTEGGVALPNGGADHETIGSGPYPAALSTLGTPANHGHAVYYCSQDIVGPATCYRSDTLGSSYGAGVAVYEGNSITGCHGLHGHIHVAPDGTAWLPVNQCVGAQGGVFSTDAGMNWHEFHVTNSIPQPRGADPSIAIDANSTIYYAYVNNEAVPNGNPPEGHARVQVGHLNKTTNTVTWSNNFDLGASHGIKNAVEIEAVGGSAGRAAVGFLGTDVNGDYQANEFPGKWYAFIATTYNGGTSWSTVNATPNDPVQNRTGVWQNGGGHDDRNLLDFNEITIDDKGRVLYGYSDGCITPDCKGGGPNDFGAAMRVARQSGGKTLLASFDNSTDTTTAKLPKAACLSGTRDPLGSHLNWRIPDNGGSNIIKYEIWRGTASGNETKLFTTLNPDPKYFDANPPASQHLFYYVKAINSVGVGTKSNEIDLTITLPPPPQSACVIPGITKLTDPAGDPSVTIINLTPTPAPPGSDLLAFNLAQPFENDNIPRLVFTLTTDPNPTGTEPSGSAWYVAMKIPGPDPAVAGDNSDFHYRGVHMAFQNPSTPTFESYTPSGNTSGGVDGRFVKPGSQKPAEPGSNYNAAGGKVTIIVKASDLTLKPGDTIAGFVSGVSQSSDPANIGKGATALYDQMPDSLSFANSYVVGFNRTCGATPQGVVSRKMHGPAGPFDITLPANSEAIESRSGGSSNSYTLVYTFGTNLSFPGAATVTQGNAKVVNTTVGPNLNQVTVNLTGVANAQHVDVSLSGVENGSHVTLPPVTAHLGVLVGDVDLSRHVDAADVGSVQRQNSKPVTLTNFRQDVDTSGHIDAADVTAVQRHNSTGLP